jgi:hypothetical protein
MERGKARVAGALSPGTVNRFVRAKLAPASRPPFTRSAMRAFC